jgi:sigma-E factor negative regulatory protein RseA
MKDRISALMDGELEIDASGHVFEALKSSEEYAASWSAYHLIGDAMRGSLDLPSDFSKRVMTRIDEEPTVLAPKRRHFDGKPMQFMSVAASVVAVMFVGWMVFKQMQTPAQDAATATLAQSNDFPASMNNYLMAHQELASEGGLPTHYARPVAYPESER